jgi:hypothetical protein
MARSRKPPIWEREAPLTPQRGAAIYRRARLVWCIGAGLVWIACASVALTSHRTLVDVAVGGMAVLTGVQAGIALWVVRNGIRANTPHRQDRPDIGL